ncbi:MAG: hypothetical protein ACP5UV_04645 [Thermoplasmata archaeon]
MESAILEVRLSDEERKILDVIRVSSENYEDTLKRIIQNYFEYQLVKNSIDEIQEKIMSIYKEVVYSKITKRAGSNEHRTVEDTSKINYRDDFLDALKRNLESNWK